MEGVGDVWSAHWEPGHLMGEYVGLVMGARVTWWEGLGGHWPGQVDFLAAAVPVSHILSLGLANMILETR